MTLNKTIFSTLESADYEVNQTVSGVPDYVSYAKLCIVSISIPAVIAPAMLAIFYSQPEQEAINIFLIILLLTDVGIAVELWCTNGLFTILYLLDVNLEPDYILHRYHSWYY